MKINEINKLNMTKLQALFVLWLRNDNFQGCSWRVLARRYFDRYKEIPGIMPNMIGSQIDGMELEFEAWKVLRPEPLIMESPDLFENDLTLIDANLSRHLKNMING